MLSHTSSRKRALAAGVAATACAALTMTALPADAAPQASTASTLRLAPRQKIGPVKNLALTLTKPGANYRVKASWDALAGATSYKVSFAAGGTTVTSPKITATQWEAPLPALTVGRSVTAKVVPYAGNKPGNAATLTQVAPDVTAPTGGYAVSIPDNSAHATITETEPMADDVTPAASITRTVEWGDDKVSSWPAGDGTISHDYATKGVYHPTVTLTDAAGNSAVVDAGAVAVLDAESPKGSFTVSPATAWAGYTIVNVTTVSVTDDVSTRDGLTCTVAWQDGSPDTVMTPCAVATHRYQVAGTYVPTVTVRDEAGKAQAVAVTGQTVVTADTVNPTVKLVKPRKRVRPAVSSWVRLHGRASDGAGSGVQAVTAKLIEKRGGAWFGYQATTKRWVKAASKAGALRKSRAATVRPVDGQWSYRVRGLKTGLLVVTVGAKDNVGNAATARTYKQLLTRR